MIRLPCVRKMPLRFISSAAALLAFAMASSLEVLHAVVVARLDGDGDFIQPVLFEHLFDDGRVKQDFASGRHLAVEGRYHALANDGAQRAGQLPPDLFALVRFEKVEDTANGLR